MVSTNTNAKTISGDFMVPQAGTAVEPFEMSMSRSVRWAMSEGSLFFDGQGRVQKSLQRISRRLDELGIPYAVAGGMALFAHGYQRFTNDIDIVMTRDDVHRMHEALDGRGWVRPFSKSKNLRDADTGVRLEFLIAGEYPGDGKPKPVQFPDPASVAVDIEGIKYLNIATFVELKLASGMTGQDREKDFIDVKELIKALRLPLSFADQLNPYVREQYRIHWQKVNAVTRRFALDRKSAGDRFDSMLKEGVTIEGDMSDDNALLVTTDPALAEKYGMHDETEFLK